VLLTLECQDLNLGALLLRFISHHNRVGGDVDMGDVGARGEDTQFGRGPCALLLPALDPEIILGARAVLEGEILDHLQFIRIKLPKILQGTLLLGGSYGHRSSSFFLRHSGTATFLRSGSGLLGDFVSSKHKGEHAPAGQEGDDGNEDKHLLQLLILILNCLFVFLCTQKLTHGILQFVDGQYTIASGIVFIQLGTHSR